MFYATDRVFVGIRMGHIMGSILRIKSDHTLDFMLRFMSETGNTHETRIRAIRNWYMRIYLVAYKIIAYIGTFCVRNRVFVGIRM